MILRKKGKIFLLVSIISILILPYQANSSNNLAEKLRGRILLQVEQQGQAWYVNPDNQTRTYLSRPKDALQIMKEYGLGITHKDIVYFQNNGFPSRLAGKILLDIENHGEAYYIYPANMKDYYLAKPADAFDLMKRLGLGVTDNKLNNIPLAKRIGNVDSIETNARKNGLSERTYTWGYKNKEYSIELNLFESVYKYYQNKSKVLTFDSQNISDDWHEQYFSLYLATDNAGGIFNDIAFKIKEQAKEQKLNKNETVELTLAFVQSIPYDNQLAEKMNTENVYMKYPYEVLYENKGVCGGKSFLAVLLFDRLGYGTSLFEFKEDNHLAAGIKCDKQYSTYNSGYCYAESTQEYPIGIIPENNPTRSQEAEISEIKDTNSIYTQSLNSLATATVRRQTQGDIYTGTENNIKQLNTIKSLKKEISKQKKQLSIKQENLNLLQNELKKIKDKLQVYKENNEYEKYNDLLTSYNSKVAENKNQVEAYNSLVKEYNSNTNNYNKLLNDLY